MASAGKRWMVVIVVAVALFPAVWLFCQFIIGLNSDISSAIAGAVIGILALPLGAWASHLPVEEKDEQHRPGGDPVAAYRELIRQHFRHVDLEVLTPLPQQTADYPPVPLLDVFVAQDTKADPPTIDLPRELRLQLFDGDLPSGRELPLGVDQAALRRIRATYDQVPKVPVLALIAGEEARRVVLLGEPGSGKSTLARYIAYNLVQEKVSGPLEPLTGWLPILIELREFARRGDEMFLDFLDRLYHAEDLGLPKDILEPILRNDGKALVIFDGLDEIFDPGLRQRTVNKIARFANNYPSTRVIVTSRPIEFRRSMLEAAGFHRHRLQDHDLAKVKAFIHNWYRAADPDDPARADKLTERLIEAVETSGSVRELAGNPLLLTILAIVGRRQRLPRDRKTVYEHAVMVLVDRWDPSRFLHDRGEGVVVPYLDAADKLEMLRLIARRMQDSPAGLSGNFISGADLIDEIAAHLQQRDAQSVTADQARAAAHEMLRQFRERSFVLSRFGTDVYGFAHRCFLEYLAAADIVHRFTSERTISETELVKEIFGTRWREPAWHEVLILVCGMLDHRYASKAIFELFGADPHWMADDAAEPRQVFLAVRCLAESRHIGRQADACRVAIEKLIRVLAVAHRRITGSFTDDLNRAVEQTLLPVFEAFGPDWPGRERFLDWYSSPGSADVDDPATMAIATKLVLALVGRDSELFAFLCAAARAGRRPALRQAAVWAIAHAWPQDEQGMSLVRQAAVASPDREVRRTAVKAVAAARKDDPRTLLMLRHVVLSDPHVDLRHAAVNAIARDWKADPETAGLLRTLCVEDPHADVRQAAIRGLAAIDPDGRSTIELLTRLSRGDHDEVRLSALTALLTARAYGLADLVRLAHPDESEDIRRLLIRTIASHHAHDPRTLPWLEGLARGDAAPGIRRAAAQAISKSWADDDDVRTFLLGRLAEDDDDTVREGVVRAMGAESLVTDDAVQRLKHCAETDAGPGVRQAAAQVIARYRRRDRSVLPWLRARAIGDTDQLVRQNVLREVAMGWPDVPDASLWLKERAERDPCDLVRRAAVQMAATMGADDPQTRRWLEERAGEDTSAQVRQAALRAMADGWPGSPRNLNRLNRHVMSDPDQQVRRTALLSIVTHWRDEPGVWPLLRDLALRTDGGDLLRRSAVRIVADGWPDGETLAVLRHCVGDEQPAVRRAAIQALAHGWPEDAQTLQTLRSRAHTDPDEYVRLTAVQEIARCWHHDPATATLLYERAETDPHQAVRLVVLQAVVTGWHDEPRALLVTRQLARSDPHPTIRAQAEQFLGEYWPVQEE